MLHWAVRVQRVADLDLEALAKLEGEATPGPWHREMLALGNGGPMTLGIGSPARAVCIVHGIVESPVGLRDVAFVTAFRNAASQLIADAHRLRDIDALMRWAASPDRQVWCGDTDSWYALRGQDLLSGETPRELAALLGIAAKVTSGWPPMDHQEPVVPAASTSAEAVGDDPGRRHRNRAILLLQLLRAQPADEAVTELSRALAEAEKRGRESMTRPTITHPPHVSDDEIAEVAKLMLSPFDFARSLERHIRVGYFDNRASLSEEAVKAIAHRDAAVTLAAVAKEEANV